jgi:small subunit ribosomal protein S9
LTLATQNQGTGRRKTSVARVRIQPGSGKVLVNGIDMERYFCRITLSRIASQPLHSLNIVEKYDVTATVHGGGLAGQAGAVSLGVARALIEADASLRGPLGKEGLLTRDARMKERKKYGQPGARKRFQFSKR